MSTGINATSKSTKLEEEADKERLAAKQLKKLEDAQTFWKGVYIFLGCLLTPYLYYSHQLNVYGHKNKPEGFDFPYYKEIWICIAMTATAFTF